MTNQTKQKAILTHKIRTPLDRGPDNKPFFQQIGAAFTKENGVIILDMELMPTEPNALIMLVPIKDDED